MANFAVLDGQNILNTIFAESKAIAEEVTGKTCIEFTNEPAEPGGTYIDGIFFYKKPYPSWVLGLNNQWKAPVEMPIDDKSYVWDEDTVSWLIYVR
jgi:hypothetical protein